MITLAISQAGIIKEWATINAMAKSNGFPESIIRNLRTKLTLKKQKHEAKTKEPNQKMGTFHIFWTGCEKNH
jgi:hypothetical protein